MGTGDKIFFGLMILGLVAIIGLEMFRFGYKSGQSDALIGKYKYSLVTNVVVEYKK